MDNAPLDWIRNMTMIKPESRLKAQQLMDRISDEKQYYGLCCDGKTNEDVAVELRNSDVEDSSGSEGLNKVESLYLLSANRESNRYFRRENLGKEGP